MFRHCQQTSIMDLSCATSDAKTGLASMLSLRRHQASEGTAKRNMVMRSSGANRRMIGQLLALG